MSRSALVMTRLGLFALCLTFRPPFVPFDPSFINPHQSFVSYTRSTMAWGLEARVPFLDKAFLDVAMNIDPEAKMFSKGSEQEVDVDGRPKMEKVG